MPDATTISAGISRAGAACAGGARPTLAGGAARRPRRTSASPGAPTRRCWTDPRSRRCAFARPHRLAHPLGGGHPARGPGVLADSQEAADRGAVAGGRREQARIVPAACFLLGRVAVRRLRAAGASTLVTDLGALRLPASSRPICVAPARAFCRDIGGPPWSPYRSVWPGSGAGATFGMCENSQTLQKPCPSTQQGSLGGRLL